MLWIILAAMTLVAAGALLLPYLRQGKPAAPRAAYDLEIYRDQLAEIERDQVRGLIGGAEAKAARTEIARRALAADAAAHEAPAATPAPARAGRRTPVIAAAAACAAPLIALGVYLAIGSPRLPSGTLAAHMQDGGKSNEELIAQLEARLKAHPEELQGWLLLARSYGTLGRFDDSVAAWREALKRAPDTAPLASQFGEALVQAADGVVTPEAIAQFETGRKNDPADPRANYYLGLAKAQAGESREALQIWTDLVAMSPADAPWLPLVRNQIRQAAAAAKIDPATIAPSPAARELAKANEAPAAPTAAVPAPGGADVAAIQNRPPEQRQAMIRTMVDSLAARLEANPNDIDGWLRLGRARHVLGDEDKSIEAYAKAAALAPERLDVQTAYADALFENMPKGGQPLPPDFVAVMRHILELDPNHGDALWFVGLAEAQAGNRMAAVALWQRLAGRLPPDSKARQDVQAQIDKLKAPDAPPSK